MRFYTRFWRLTLCFLACLVLSVSAQAQSSSPPASAATPAPQTRRLPPAADPYTPHLPARALAYQRSARIVGLFGLAWNLLGIWLILRTGLSARLRDLALRGRSVAAGKPPQRVAVARYFAAYVILLALWSLPIGLAYFQLEHRYGFSTQSLGGYFSDWGTQLALEAIKYPLLLGGYWLYARSPRHWWKWVWAAAVPIIFVSIVLQPVVISPLYNDYTPLPPGELRTKILALASKAGITGADVFVESTSRRTTHVNAYVTGLGPTTRIVLNDTALQQLPEDQLLAMMGHEMGHYVEGHIWWGFLSGALGAGLFLWPASRLLPWLEQLGRPRWKTRGLNDLAALPMIHLVIALFLLAQFPVESAISRYMERRADAFGLRVTGLNDATARLMVGFAERDYTDPDPPPLLHFWFGSHPTLSERIAFARAYRR